MQLQQNFKNSVNSVCAKIFYKLSTILSLLMRIDREGAASERKMSKLMIHIIEISI